LLLKATYAVKTQAGISDQSYCSSDENPLYGEGQGTRWATAAWVIISTLIIGLMPQKADGIQFQDPQRTLIVKRIMDGFVDDTTIWQNLANNLDALSQGSTGEIATRLKTAAQWWEQLLLSDTILLLTFQNKDAFAVFVNLSD
jgi:hypothetical protein